MFSDSEIKVISAPKRANKETSYPPGNSKVYDGYVLERVKRLLLRGGFFKIGDFGMGEEAEGANTEAVGSDFADANALE
jgi:hypothetical protein